MYLHANAKLGLAARFALVQAVEGGCSIRSAATRFNVSPATAHRWWHRWLEAGEEARRTVLSVRSSQPPRQLAPQLEKAISAPAAALQHYKVRLRQSRRVRYRLCGLCCEQPGGLASLASTAISFVVRASRTSAAHAGTFSRTTGTFALAAIPQVRNRRRL
jgi:transposase-like protein